MRTERNRARLDRVFARLDREPERPAHIEVPSMSRHRVVFFGATLVFYAAIIAAVVETTWLVRLDWQVMFFRPYQQWPEIHAFLDYYVVLGQRGPTAVMVAAWLGWRSWRQHTLRPLLALGTSLLLLNVTVGAAKLGMGRLGPHYATVIGSNEMWKDGDIFPSGHTANAVVTWGILAYLASTPQARRWLSALSAVVALGVGLTTVYLGTHWLSDVLLGWAAGLLILLALPWFEPLFATVEARLLRLRDLVRDRRFAAPVPLTPVPAMVPADPADPVPARGTDVAALGTDMGTREGARYPRHGHSAAPGGLHPVRGERTPGAPTGGRRPTHGDRLPRTNPSARPVTGS
ncbi:phosphatase PAP2 family protein [Streptomyces sp. NA04227]|uniref:phosphatase PAP2 family protein n=1 Tax=Streptomyces sp. NA04227 TaxID=2742136 RepID=UPI001592023B|nr:phosphatase PAP2 family protein [Streptomyces sp. NA04227]QKW05711.1 phosphatase PAP2 family protein [Streptomyces sp. NA04227]